MTEHYQKVSVEAPSNIALIKYWGKADEAWQWPAGDSLSMTLSNCRTSTTVDGCEGEDQFYFEGVKLSSEDVRAQKPLKHISDLKNRFNYNGGLRVETQNSFPAGCGIASSASGFAALTLSVTAFLNQCGSFEKLERLGLTKESLSHLARIGSGSAGRSIYGGYVKWQKGPSPEKQIIRPVYEALHWKLADTIVVVSDGRKHVSSSEAHRAAFTSPLFQTRLSGLDEKMQRLESAIAAKDILTLGPIIEEEALEMHSVIMTATPSVHYLTKETYEILNWLRDQRSTSGIKAYFTIDAGANVHIISEKSDQEPLIKSLKQAFKDYKIIGDEVGVGARFIND